MQDPTVTIAHILPEEFREAATSLYLDAFYAKVEPILGSGARAHRFLLPHLRADRLIAAIGDNNLLGIAGLHYGGFGAFEPRLSAFLREFGISALWRIPLALVMKRAEVDGVLLMDGLSVSPAARGRGIGTRLLDAVVDRARQMRLAKVRLDVVDTNPDARRLYERLGFVPDGSVELGFLSRCFPFRSATRMFKSV